MVLFFRAKSPLAITTDKKPMEQLGRKQSHLGADSTNRLRANRRNHLRPVVGMS